MFSSKRYALLGLIGTCLVLMSMTMQMSCSLFVQTKTSVEWTMQWPDSQELPDGAEKDGDGQSDSLVTTFYYADFISALAQLPEQQYPLDAALPEDPLSLPFQPPV